MKTTNALPDALEGVSNIVEFRKEAWEDVGDSFEKFRLTCGIGVLQGMMEEDVAEFAGERRESVPDKPGCRRGSVVSRFDFHGGEVTLE